MTSAREASHFGLDGRTVARTHDLLSHVAAEMEVVADYALRGIVGVD